LRAANATLGRPLAEDVLLRLAAEVGSDVPFFVRGRGAALARGRGERLIDLTLESSMSIAVAWPGTPLPTAQVYAAPGPRATGARLAAAAAGGAGLGGASPAELAASIVNDLGPAAEALLPATRALRLALLARGALAAAVSGSGSAVFGLFPGMPDARR